MVKVRHATEGDWARLYAMRNEPTARANCLQEKPIELKEHLAWLVETLEKDTVTLYVAYDVNSSGVTVGMCRADLIRGQRPKAALSIAVDASQRGKGYATQIIRALIVDLKESSWKLKAVTAVIKPDNYASLRAFADVGFVIKKIEDLVTLEYVL